MHLTNSTGQTVSLLNDERATAARRSQALAAAKSLNLGGLSLEPRPQHHLRRGSSNDSSSSSGSADETGDRGAGGHLSTGDQPPHHLHHHPLASSGRTQQTYYAPNPSPPHPSAADAHHRISSITSATTAHTAHHTKLGLPSSTSSSSSSATTTPPPKLPAPSTLLTSPPPPLHHHHPPRPSSERPHPTHRPTSSLAAAIEPRIDFASAVPSPYTPGPASLASSLASSAVSTPRSLFPPPISSSTPSSARSAPTLPGLGRAHVHRHAHPARPRLRHGRPYSPSDARKASYSSAASSATTASSSDRDDSPVFSPPAGHHARAPQLLRNDSSSAGSSRSLSTPSPMTPTYGFDPIDQNKQAAQLAGLVDPYGPVARHGAPYFPGGPAGAGPQHMMPQPGMPFYPVVGPASVPMGPEDAFAAMPPAVTGPGAAQMGVVPYAADLIEPSPHFQPTAGSSVSPPNAAAQPVAASGAGGAGTTQQKARKKYPCPHAARYGCTDTFTTSGHAARHGKKHTGEKNILCPTCHKAFTRKDNMKQHERTHRNNRDSVASAGSADTGSAHKRGKPNNHHASTSSLGGHPSDNASTGSIPTAGDMDLDPLVASYDPQMQMRAMPGHAGMMPQSMDFNHMSTGNVFLDADLEAGGPSPAADETAFGMSDLRKRPAGVERQVSHGSQDGEGESPGLDALAMAASGLT